MKSALEIKSGQELKQFYPGTILIDNTYYNILTGYENNEHRCFWCGIELKGKAKRYCRGHMTEYYNHFARGNASFEALKRADHKCENCGKPECRLNILSSQINLEVHHIVPLNGAPRQFTAFNLPWNLIVFCNLCHQLIHAIMRGSGELLSIYDKALLSGQGILVEV